MNDKTRRIELGKMLLDVAKYVLTVVVISGLVSAQIDVGTVLFGMALAISLAGMGFFVIPVEEVR